MFIYLALALLISCSCLQAILDGRAAPIFLDTRYTFTDGEWARGTIHFNEGFDLPTQGTVYLNLDGGAIYESINLNSGTIIATKTMTLLSRSTIIGPGFMKNPSLTPTFIYYSGVSLRLFRGAGKIKILGPWTIEGLSNTAVFDQIEGCTLDFTGCTDNITLAGGLIFWRSILTSLNNPPAFFFVNTDVLLLTSSINTEYLFFRGINTITPVVAANIQKLVIDSFSKTKILPGAAIKLRGLDVQFKGTRLELQNTSLDFISSTTGQINIAMPHPSSQQGTISLDGQCSIKSSTLNTLWLDSAVNLELYAGARLSIEPKTQLSILNFP